LVQDYAFGRVSNSAIRKGTYPVSKGHRLVARFIAGELVKMTHFSPEWLKRFFGRELRSLDKQRE